MNLYVFKSPCKTEWVCDSPDCCGAPPIGRGTNKYEAVGSYLFAVRHEPVFVSMLNRSGFTLTEVTDEVAERNSHRADLIAHELKHKPQV